MERLTGKKPATPPADPGAQLYVYSYHDATGQTVAEKRVMVVNGQPPRISWRAASEEIPVSEAPLYRLQELLAAKPGEPVWLVEHEGVADALAKLGVVATCLPHLPGRVRRWNPALLEPLKGHQVVVARSDTPAGLQWYRTVRPKLSELSISVRPIALRPTAYAAVRAPGFDPVAACGGGLEVEPAARDALRMTIDGLNSRIGVVLERIAQQGRELSGRLTVTVPGAPVSYSADVNLRSQSTRETLARNLKQLFGDEERWPLVVQQIAEQAERHVVGSINAVHWRQLQDAAVGDLVHNMIVDWGITVLFGTGASLKSMTALSMAVAVASGKTSWQGLPISDNGPVLWIDWEDARAVRGRVERMLEASPGPDPDIRVLDPGGSPYIDLHDRVQSIVAQEGIRLVVIDSAMHAAHGPAEDGSVAGQMLRALRALDLPVLIISHTNRSDSQYAKSWGRADMVPSYPYGNVVWRNLARRCLYQRVRTAGLYGYAAEIWETKSNRAAGFNEEPLRLLISFSGGIDVSSPAWLGELVQASDDVKKGGGRGDPPELELDI